MNIALAALCAIAIWAFFRHFPAFWMVLLVVQSSLAVGSVMDHRYGMAAFWTVLTLASLANAAMADHRKRERRDGVL